MNLYHYDTANYLRPATQEEADESMEANETGAISVDLQIEVDADPDSDDALGDAERAAQRKYNLPGYDLSPKWGEDRETIILDFGKTTVYAQ